MRRQRELTVREARRRSRLGWLAALALLLAAFVVLAGCGGDESSSTPPSSGGAASSVSGADSPSPSPTQRTAKLIRRGGGGSSSSSTAGEGGSAGSSASGGSSSAGGSSASSGSRPSSSSGGSTGSSTKPKPTLKPKPTKPPAAAPYFTVTGNVSKSKTFTLAQLKRMRTVSATYFSRGKVPKTEHNRFVGVRMSDILSAAGVAANARRVTVTASDACTASFSMSDVTEDYIDETRPGVKLPMIIAYSQDGALYKGANPFRLVRGQAIEGEYNRQFWVRMIVTIEVQ